VYVYQVVIPEVVCSDSEGEMEEMCKQLDEVLSRVKGKETLQCWVIGTLWMERLSMGIQCEGLVQKIRTRKKRYKWNSAMRRV
jgi:hypothetical protein